MHWLSRPSEEQLLGPLPHPLGEVNVSFEPPPAPDWALSDTQVPDGNGAGTRRWRLGPRDLVALAAVAAVVWLAVRSGDGLPFRSSQPAAPAAAGHIVRTTLAPDRADSTRTSPSTDGTASGLGSKSDGGRKDKNDAPGPGRNDDDPPTGGGGGGGGSEQPKPLVEATIPGVGTVTVDERDLPTLPDVDTPSLPALPDTDDLLPETPTFRSLKREGGGREVDRLLGRGRNVEVAFPFMRKLRAFL